MYEPSTMEMVVEWAIVSDLLGVISGLLSVVLVVIGVRLIRDLRLRSVDAICDFYAKLKVLLRDSRRWSRNFENDEVAPEYSVFIWLSEEDTKKTLVAKNKFTEDRYANFVESIREIDRLFKASDGQVPLSSKLYEDLEKLNAIVLCVLAKVDHKEQFPLNALNPKEGELLNDSAKIQAFAREFDSLIEGIIEEIDLKTKKLLGGLWKHLSKK